MTVQYVCGTLKKRNRYLPKLCVMGYRKSSRPPKASSRHHDGQRRLHLCDILMFLRPSCLCSTITASDHPFLQVHGAASYEYGRSTPNSSPFLLWEQFQPRASSTRYSSCLLPKVSWTAPRGLTQPIPTPPVRQGSPYLLPMEGRRQ